MAIVIGKKRVQFYSLILIALHKSVFSLSMFHSILSMLEGIIQAPIFFQMSAFSLQLAILLFEIENVSKNSIPTKIFDCNLIKKDFYFQNVTRFSFNLAFDTISGAFYLIANYVLCYFLSNLTIDVMSIVDRVFDVYWYQLARKEQFIALTIIRRSQNPFVLKGLGVFDCSLSTFLTVNMTTVCKICELCQ